MSQPSKRSVNLRISWGTASSLQSVIPHFRLSKRSRKISGIFIPLQIIRRPIVPAVSPRSVSCTRLRGMMHGYYLSTLSLNTSFRDQVEDVVGRWREVLARSRMSNRRATWGAIFDIFFSASLARKLTSPQLNRCVCISDF